MIENIENSHKGRVTLRQIAEAIGVDVATVSRALAGQAEVGEKRRKEIIRLAQKLGYRPKPLRRKSAEAIGLLISAPSMDIPDENFLKRIIYEAETCAAKLGKLAHVEFLRSDGDNHDWSRLLLTNRVDGILIVGRASDAFYDRLKLEKFPAVALNEQLERANCDCVFCDPKPGISEAVSRLLALGHQKIGLALTDMNYATMQGRYNAYISSHQLAGVNADMRLVLTGIDSGLHGGQQVITHYICNGILPTAIIFGNDIMALGGMYELSQRGIRVPRDVSIIGYDNTTLGSNISPALTSIDNREKELVCSGLMMLEQLIQGHKSPATVKVIPSKLLWRETCSEPYRECRN